MPINSRFRVPHQEVRYAAPIETDDLPPRGLTRRNLLAFAPVAGAAGLLGLLALGLGRDPSIIPSELIGRSVPDFELPPVPGRTLGLSSAHLLGQVALVNVFASWCVPCRLEHPLFLQLARDKVVTIHGINYKDPPEDAAKWLDTLGDPYTRTGADRDGRVAIDWGVYGVPETFVVGADGIIAHKHVGPVTEQALSETILPLVSLLQKRAGGAPA